MMQFISVIGTVIVAVSLFTVLLGKAAKQKAYIKYIPALLLLLSGIYYLYKARTGHEGFEDLGNFLFALLLLTGAVSGAVTGGFMDYFLPRMRKKGR